MDIGNSIPIDTLSDHTDGFIILIEFIPNKGFQARIVLRFGVHRKYVYTTKFYLDFAPAATTASSGSGGTSKRRKVIAN